MKESVMVNLVGLLRRAAPCLGGGAIHLAGWASYGLVLVALCLLWWRSSQIEEKHMGIAIILSLFAAPHLHYHDLALLLVALASVMIDLVRDSFLKSRDAALIPLGVSLLLLLGSLVPVIKLNLPYLVMLLIILALWFPSKVLLWKRRQDEIVS